MSSSFQRLALSALLGSFIAASASARDVTLRLLAFDQSVVRDETYAFDPASIETPGVPAPIKGFLNHETITIPLVGSGILFSAVNKAEVAARVEAFVALAKIPEQGNRFILIFLPGPAGKAPVLVVDDTVQAFPLGSYQVFNLSGKPVRLTLEGKPFEYAPGKNGIVEDPPVQENQHSAMYAFTQSDGKWQRIGSGLWPHPGTRRSIQIFYDNPRSERTELKGFRDIAPPTIKEHRAGARQSGLFRDRMKRGHSTLSRPRDSIQPAVHPN
jgi:hypothetical protein